MNEKEVDKIFWPAEKKIKLLLKRAGSNCKAMVVFDCCREDLVEAKNRVIQEISKTKFQLGIESLGKSDQNSQEEEKSTKAQDSNKEEY